MHSSLSPSLLFFLRPFFIFVAIVCYSSDWFFLIISSSLVKILTVCIYSFLNSVILHTTNASNFLSSKLFIFVAFSEIFCHFSWHKLLCLHFTELRVSLWNSVEKLPMVGLRWYLYMGASLYCLHGSKVTLIAELDLTWTQVKFFSGVCCQLSSC